MTDSSRVRKTWADRVNLTHLAAGPVAGLFEAGARAQADPPNAPDPGPNCDLPGSESPSLRAFRHHARSRCVLVRRPLPPLRSRPPRDHRATWRTAGSGSRDERWWKVLLGTGATACRARALAAALGPEPRPGQDRLGDRLEDVCGPPFGLGGEGRLILDADEMPAEDIGFVRRFLDGTIPGWALLVLGMDAGRTRPPAPCSLPRTRAGWPWPPDLEQLRALALPASGPCRRGRPPPSGPRAPAAAPAGRLGAKGTSRTWPSIGERGWIACLRAPCATRPDCPSRDRPRRGRGRAARLQRFTRSVA